MTNNALINSLGKSLQALRLDDEAQVLVSIAANAPNPDTWDGSISVTIASGPDTATSEAVALADAILLARGKLKDMAKKRAAEKAKLKGDAA